ncbi:MAG: hypothetical protein H6Q17_549 [Bacteroidetes bacterium]|nr:hypothetical protein [Bacteroidota bacterium]
MTVYELATEMIGDNAKLLEDNGLINRTLSHQMFVYSQYSQLIESGLPRMQAYTEISLRYYMSEDSVKSIVSKFKKEIAM